MPGFDGTGPAGRGEMTGRGRGWCIVEVTAPETLLPGCGTGRMYGGGRMFRGGRHQSGGRFNRYTARTVATKTPDKEA